jgi:hypothetical protein
MGWLEVRDLLFSAANEFIVVHNVSGNDEEIVFTGGGGNISIDCTTVNVVSLSTSVRNQCGTVGPLTRVLTSIVNCTGEYCYKC